MSPEFNLIQQYFTRPTRHTNLSIGDDAALISLALGMELAISTDMLVAGTHFFHDADAYQLGWKSLAVNVSDMAAMGANPKWVTLAIALPEINHAWLAEFSRGFFACADAVSYTHLDVYKRQRTCFKQNACDCRLFLYRDKSTSIYLRTFNATRIFTTPSPRFTSTGTDCPA